MLLWSLSLNIVQLFGFFIFWRNNNKINRFHEIALRIVYDDDVSTFDQLFVMDKAFRIHYQDIQRLLIEIYKPLHDISENSLK